MVLKRCNLIMFLIIAMFLTPAPGNGDKSPDSATSVRPAAVAGKFYPADPAELRTDVMNYLHKAGNPVIKGDLLAIMSPHAGYVFSGQVAAYSYKELSNRVYDTVIILGPSHYVPLSGASVFSKGYYAVPGAEIPVNSVMAKKIIDKKSSIFDSPSAHYSREHCIEVQLPFLQATMKNFSIVPILIGQVDENFCKVLADRIVKSIKDTRTLIVASSDMSHYPPYKIAKEVDSHNLQLIKNMDTHGLHQSMQKDVRKYGSRNLATCMCGEWPVITTILATKQLGGDTVEILKYANSGDVKYGDTNSVVGYGAVGFYIKKK